MTPLLRLSLRRAAMGCALLALLLTAGTASAQAIINENGGFESSEPGQTSGIAHWQMLFNEGATAEVVADPDDAENLMLRVELTDTSVAANPWDIQVRHYADPALTLVEGHEHQVSFRIRAENPTEGGMQLDGGTGAQLWGQTLSGADWQTFTTDVFTAGADDARTMAIHLGADTNPNGQVFYIDDFEVVDMDYVEPSFWSFEDQEMGDWYAIADAANGYSTTAVISDAQAADGTYSVLVSVGDDQTNGAFANDTYEVTPGDTIRYHVYVPAGEVAEINGLQPFMQHGEGWSYVDQWYGATSLTADAWNTLDLVVPEGAGMTQRIGLQVTGHDAAGMAEIYVDAIEVIAPEVDEGMTIAEARAAGVDEEVTITGTVTRSMGDFTYIQDETAGLAIRQVEGAFFDAVADGTIAPGTMVQVTGTLSEYASLLQINENDLASYEVVGSGDVPASQVVTLQQLGEAGEDYEAELIRVSDLMTDATGVFEAGTSYEVMGEGDAIGVLRVPNADDTAVDGMGIPAMPFIFNGVVGQFNFDDPAAGYQLLAIQEGDVREMPPDGLLNTNGSFEYTDPLVVEDLAGDVPGWIFETNEAVATAPVYAIVDDAAQDGDQSLQVTVMEAGGSSWHIQAIADSIEVVPGEEYTYSVWARAAEEGAMASFTVGNYAFDEYGALRDQALTTEWEEYTMDFTITDEEMVIRAPIHFSYAGNVDNPVYVDNLRIMEAEGIATDPNGEEGQFALAQNYPNPFHPSTVIEYEIGTSSHVTLAVYNALGQRVATLVDAPMTAGSHEVAFDGRDLASGLYFYRMEAGDVVETRRMLLIK